MKKALLFLMAVHSLTSYAACPVFVRLMKGLSNDPEGHTVERKQATKMSLENFPNDTSPGTPPGPLARIKGMAFLEGDFKTARSIPDDNLPYKVVRKIAVSQTETATVDGLNGKKVMGSIQMVTGKIGKQNIAEVRVIQVRSDARREGIGQELLSDAISMAQNQKVDLLRIVVPQSNAAMIGLAEKNGFQKVAAVDDDSIVPTHESTVNLNSYDKFGQIQMKNMGFGQPNRRFKEPVFVYSLKVAQGN